MNKDESSFAETSNMKNKIKEKYPKSRIDFTVLLNSDLWLTWQLNNQMVGGISLSSLIEFKELHEKIRAVELYFKHRKEPIGLIDEDAAYFMEIMQITQKAVTVVTDND